VSLAARGLRDMDGGPEPIADPEERTIVRTQARKVQLGAVLLALVAAAISTFLGP
jgi:hypothetical protein